MANRTSSSIIRTFTEIRQMKFLEEDMIQHTSTLYLTEIVVEASKALLAEAPKEEV